MCIIFLLSTGFDFWWMLTKIGYTPTPTQPNSSYREYLMGTKKWQVVYISLKAVQRSWSLLE